MTLTSLKPTDPKGRMLKTAMGPVHIVEEGPHDGVPMLLFHGIPGNVRDFRYLGPELAAQNIRAIRVDCAGFGETPWSSFPHAETLALAQWRIHLLDALDVESAVLGAHSFGGIASICAAAQNPERIRALVLMCSPGLKRHKGLQFIPPTIIKLMAKGFRSRRAAPFLAGAFRKSYEQARFKGVSELSDEDLHHHAQLVGELDFKTQRWAARTLTAPTFIFSGGKDFIVEPEVSFHLAEALAKGGRMRVEHHHFRKGGHHLQRDEAPFIARTLARALARGL